MLQRLTIETHCLCNICLAERKAYQAGGACNYLHASLLQRLAGETACSGHEEGNRLPAVSRPRASCQAQSCAAEVCCYKDPSICQRHCCSWPGMFVHNVASDVLFSLEHEPVHVALHLHTHGHAATVLWGLTHFFIS